ncbi:hypothetical protein PENSPDRAFT_575171 [Peniophora sp. CONT]|nr:hypothetical protein PENSPDRAFT_575171 [Peniophora sp. CONT]
MFTTLISAAALSLLAARGAMADFSVNSPTFTQASGVCCASTQITWSGTSKPVNILVVPAEDPCDDTLADLGDHTKTSMSWNVSLPAGTQLLISLEDSEGEEAWSDTITVQPSSDASCLSAAQRAALPAASNSTASASAASSAGAASSAVAVSPASTAVACVHLISMSIYSRSHHHIASSRPRTQMPRHPPLLVPSALPTRVLVLQNPPPPASAAHPSLSRVPSCSQAPRFSKHTPNTYPPGKLDTRRRAPSGHFFRFSSWLSNVCKSNLRWVRRRQSPAGWLASACYFPCCIYSIHAFRVGIAAQV